MLKHNDKNFCIVRQGNLKNTNNIIGTCYMMRYVYIFIMYNIARINYKW